MRKLIGLLTISLLIGSGLMSAPAQAFNKKIVNGVSCSKTNATTKGKGNESYKCVKNPYFQKTRMTWTWTECLNAQKSLVTFRNEHNALIAAGAGAVDVASSQEFLNGWGDATKQACARGV